MHEYAMHALTTVSNYDDRILVPWQHACLVKWHCRFWVPLSRQHWLLH